MLDLKQLSDEEVVVLLYHRLYQSTDTIFDNYWGGEDVNPLAKEIRQEANSDCGGKIVGEVKERKRFA